MNNPQSKPTGSKFAVGTVTMAKLAPRTSEEEPKPTGAKPTGEWTPKFVADMVEGNRLGWGVVADAHNATLAAERANTEAWNRSYHQVQLELAAEREKVQTLTDALKEIWVQTLDEDAHRIADSALAKVGTYPLPNGRTK